MDLAGTKDRCTILLKHPMMVSSNFFHPWLDNGVHHMDVSVTTNMQVLLEEDWRHDVILIGGDHQDHSEICKLSWYDDGHDRNIQRSFFFVTIWSWQISFSLEKSIDLSLARGWLSLFNSLASLSFPWWLHAWMENFWGHGTCIWSLHGYNQFLKNPYSISEPGTSLICQDFQSLCFVAVWLIIWFWWHHVFSCWVFCEWNVFKVLISCNHRIKFLFDAITEAPWQFVELCNFWGVLIHSLSFCLFWNLSARLSVHWNAWCGKCFWFLRSESVSYLVTFFGFIYFVL